MSGNRKKPTSERKYYANKKRQRIIKWTAWTIISIMVISIVAGFFW